VQPSGPLLPANHTSACIPTLVNKGQIMWATSWGNLHRRTACSTPLAKHVSTVPYCLPFAAFCYRHFRAFCVR